VSFDAAFNETAPPVLWERDKCYLGGELLEAQEAGVLAALGTSLLLALSANGRLSGFLSLELKAADEPLSPVDLHGLESIASAAAFALEGSYLRAALAEELTEVKGSSGNWRWRDRCKSAFSPVG